VKSGSRFEQAKLLHFYVSEVYITDPITTVYLDVSSLRQALDTIKKKVMGKNGLLNLKLQCYLLLTEPTAWNGGR